MPAVGCPDPAYCPVPRPETVNLAHLRTLPIAAGRRLFTAYPRAHWGAGPFNPSGLGDTRFAPIVDTHGAVVPTVYVAATATVALLETVFHEVQPTGARAISESIDLVPRGLGTLVVPGSGLRLYDLTDPALALLGLGREHLVSCSPEHYACTREWATVLRTRHPGGTTPVGIVWHSRITELNAAHMGPVFADLLTDGNRRVAVVFGDRIGTDVALWQAATDADDLTSGAGRTFVDDIALQIAATVLAP